MGVDELPKAFYAADPLVNHIKIEESVGVGNLAAIPWPGFFDLRVSNTARTGYCVVLLYRSNISKFHLSLNHGWTQYEMVYGTKNIWIMIRDTAAKVNALLGELDGFTSEPLDLRPQYDLGRGYKLGNIHGRYYPVNALPLGEELLQDSSLLMDAYDKIIKMVGPEITALETPLQALFDMPRNNRPVNSDPRKIWLIHISKGAESNYSYAKTAKTWGSEDDQALKEVSEGDLLAFTFGISLSGAGGVE